MKKFLTLVAASLLFTAAQASATPFTLDLSTLGMGTYSNIDRIVLSGSASVKQTFGADHQFTNGDTFTEMSLMSTMTYYVSPGNPSDYTAFSFGGKKLYSYASGLTGSVYNVSTPSANPSTWKFDYVFDPGQHVYIYADTDLNPANGATIVADLVTGVPSGGQGPAGFLGGGGPNGTTDITAYFDPSTPANIWSVFGYDLRDGALALLNTHNTVRGVSFNFDPTQLPTGFDANITSDGELRVVTPEPGTFALLGAGLIGLGLVRRRRNKK